MGEATSTLKDPRNDGAPSGPPGRRVKKDKEEDPSNIVIYESSTSASEDESGSSGGEQRGRRKQVKSRKKESQTTSDWLQEEIVLPPSGEDDLNKLAVDEKNLDPTSATIHGILYGRDYKKDDEGRSKIRKGVLALPKDNLLVHTLTGKETLQGLALKYGVQASDIKKINRLWNNEDIFALKQVVIPTTNEEYLNFQAAQALNTKTTKNISILESLSADQKSLITKFMDVASCEPDIAQSYLVQKNWDYSKALALFYSQQDSDGSDEETKRKHLDEKARKIRQDEMEEITEEPLQRSSFHSAPVASYLLPTDDKSFSVHRVQKRLQERFAKQDEEIFEI